MTQENLLEIPKLGLLLTSMDLLEIAHRRTKEMKNGIIVWMAILVDLMTRISQRSSAERPISNA